MKRKLPITVWTDGLRLSRRLIKNRYERPGFCRVVDYNILSPFSCIIWVDSYVDDYELYLLDLVTYDNDNDNPVYFALGIVDLRD